MREMTKMDEAKMVNTINAVMNKVHGGADPTETIIIVANDQNMAPEAAARVCEACNKIMSIDRLSSSDQGVRTGQYPLADAGVVVKRLTPCKDEEDDNMVVIKKTASDGVPELKGMTPVTYSKAEKAFLTRHSRKEAYDEGVRQFKVAAEEYLEADNKVRQEEVGAEEDYKSLVELTQNLGNKDALDLARYVESTYGSLGKDLIQMLSEAIDKPLPEPSAKEASAFASPGTSLYRAVDRFMEHGYNRLEHMMRRDMASKRAGDGLVGIMKDVAGVGDVMNPKTLPSDDTQSPFSPSTSLKMRNMALKDGFANMYLDDKFLLQYPPETVLDAYNKVLQLHPELAMRTNADALITSIVKRIITSNNEIDPLEIPSAATAEKALVDTRSRSDLRPWD